MTTIIQNFLTEFVKLSLGWGAWLTLILLVIGAAVIIKKIVNLIKTITAKSKKSKKKQNKAKGVK